MSTPTPNSPKKRPEFSSVKYLSMASYMAIIITLGTLGGRWLDAHVHFVKFPLFTLVLALVSVFASMWYFIRDFIKK
jgi:membrane protein DedA with SNARE-associated domain